MTPEAQRIAIAEACGWKNIQMSACVELATGWKDGWKSRLPDYPADLNAMHEAEEGLFDRNDWSACRYEETLKSMTRAWAWHATAAQRAEAFLRTIGKWEDDK